MHEKSFFQILFSVIFPKGNLSHNYLPKSKLILILNIQDAIWALLHEASFTTLIIECQTIRNYLEILPYCTGGEMMHNSPEQLAEIEIHTALESLLVLFTSCKKVLLTHKLFNVQLWIPN